MQIHKIATQYESALQTISFSSSALFVSSVSMSGLVLTPVAVLAGVLGVWRLGVDPGWTKNFFIANGLMSHYQLWFGVAIGAQTSAFILNRWVADQKLDPPVLRTEPAHLRDLGARPNTIRRPFLNAS